jgi:hypothetical protein
MSLSFPILKKKGHTDWLADLTRKCKTVAR